MEDLQYIVQRLNDEPFSLRIRAVELEEQTPAELLQLVIDVTSTLNEDLKADASVESILTVEKLVQFLRLHNCKLVPQNESELEQFSNGIADGQHLIPILHYILSNYEHLQKRCYLATYLMPITVPEEYLRQDPNLVELLQSYQDLQSEFIEIHKEYDRVIAGSGAISVAELVAETKQLGNEKKQLLERLRREEDGVRGDVKFEQLRNETSKLTQAQDEEIRLTDQKDDQNKLLSAAAQRLEQVRHLCDILRSLSNSSEVEFDDILHKSIQDHEVKIARKQNESQVKLAEAKKQKTCGGIEEMEARAIDLEDTLERKLIELDEASQQSFSLENILRFRKHVDVASAKLQAKQQYLKLKEMEKVVAADALERARVAFDDHSCSAQMQELEQLRLDVKCQTKAYQEAKEEIDAMQQANTELNETKLRLEEELNLFRASLKDQEEDAGVVGFHSVNAELQHISHDTSALNETKSQTLAEISNTIQQIALVLSTKRKELEPKVQGLKKAREQFLEFEERFKSEKALYKELAMKAKIENEGLEQENTRLQAVVAEKETMYQNLCESNEILKDNIQCCESEDVSLLEAKASHHEELLNGLRRQHAEMHNKKEHNARQQVLFSNLMKLLDLKAKSLDGIEP